MLIQAVSAISVAELVVYPPCFFLVVWVCLRHGFGRQAGWALLIFFPILRILGAASQLATDKDPNSTLITIALICNNLGQPPLILASLYLLKRIADGIDALPFRAARLHALHIPVSVGAVLCIVGGVNIFDSNPGNDGSAHALTQAGVCLFLAVFVCVCILAIVMYYYLGQVARGERTLLYCITVALPFLFVRVLYSVLVSFRWRSSVWNLFNGNVVARGMMAVFEEFVIVAIFIIAGFITPVIPRENVQPGLRRRRRNYQAGLAHEQQSGLAGQSAPQEPKTMRDTTLNTNV
ncbi:MAG: hypothetical protein M1833_002345 [Piccolia ochrophora]|nr:MAG: hypothetical protein M1833_002345 [Piccolia ochrophora]